MTALVWLLLVAWLPAAVAFRWPCAGRDQRSALAAEERVFWAVVLSVTWSVIVVMALASVGEYRFERLLIVNGVVSAVPALVWRGRLRYGNARPPSYTALVPAAIVAFGAWSFLPPSEFVIGGKDPGVYVNEGVQIAQRGGLIIVDPVVASVPANMRELFMPPHRSNTYYSLRFMGFFVQDPQRGAVIGQFPHLFPASIAIGYGVNGLSGARQTVVFWAVLGLAALYFAGTQVVGRPAAAAAAGLLSVHAIEVWFARYPNSEVTMQALSFAAALAFARALDGQRQFFGPVAGVLVGLQLFLRYDAVLAVGTFAAAATLALFDRRYTGWNFVTALVLTSVAGVLYLKGPMRAYLRVRSASPRTTV